MFKNRRSALMYVAVAAALAILMITGYRATVGVGLAPGRPMPSFTLPDAAGGLVASADWEGQPVLLRFSSVKCSYCTDDFNYLQQLQGRNPEIIVAAIQMNDTRTGVQRVLAGRHTDFPVLLDEEGRLADVFNLRGLPMYYFFGADGKLVDSIHGEPTAMPHTFDALLGHIRWE